MDAAFTAPRSSKCENPLKWLLCRIPRCQKGVDSAQSGLVATWQDPECPPATEMAATAPSLTVHLVKDGAAGVAKQTVLSSTSADHLFASA